MSGGSALLGAAGYSDYKASQSAKKAQKKNISKGTGAYMDALDRTRALGSRGIALQGDALNTLKSANKKAMGIAAGLGTSATNRVLDQQQQGMANNQQSLASRGLYNTTALDAANRGTRSDTNRALAEITDSLGGLQISTLQQGAGSEANAMQQLSQYLQAQGISESQIYEALASFLGGIQHIPGQPALGTLGSFAKLGASAFGGGAGAGSAFASGPPSGGGGIF